MSQSAMIFVALIFLFVVFITMKGQLPTYLGILGLAPSSTSASNGASQTAGTLPGPLTIAATGITALPALASISDDMSLFSTIAGAS